MPRNYKKETTVVTKTLTERVRAYEFQFHNPLNGALGVTILEESTEQLDDGPEKSKEALGKLNKSLKQSDINKSFDLIDPTLPEGEDVVGSMTYGQMYAALYSLYFHLVEERDRG